MLKGYKENIITDDKIIWTKRIEYHHDGVILEMFKVKDEVLCWNITTEDDSLLIMRLTTADSEYDAFLNFFKSLKANKNITGHRVNVNHKIKGKSSSGFAIGTNSAENHLSIIFYSESEDISSGIKLITYDMDEKMQKSILQLFDQLYELATQKKLIKTN